MRSGKPWFKKILLAAGIIAVIGVGINLASKMDRPDYHHGKQKERTSFMSAQGGGNGWAGPNGRHDRGMRGEGGEHDGWGAGAVVGGTLLGAGLLLWAIKRRKRPAGARAALAAPIIPSTSEFLDQWEQNQTTTTKKESN